MAVRRQSTACFEEGSVRQDAKVYYVLAPGYGGSIKLEDLGSQKVLFNIALRTGWTDLQRSHAGGAFFSTLTLLFMLISVPFSLKESGGQNQSQGDRTRLYLMRYQHGPKRFRYSTFAASALVKDVG
ncbi:hypothetical protein AAF712_012391 [Marasmius tenuissimus]|uniref:Uncharacterized protein n=1 Tax=Marasmius tenuissimus TaxID=585030 RepID=A0ABR2ZJ67_9AGAR